MCASLSPELWGLSQIREREIFSQQLRPSDSGQKEGGDLKERTGNLQLPQLFKGHESAKREAQPASGTPSAPLLQWAVSLLHTHSTPFPLLPLKRARQWTPAPLGPQISGNASLSHSIPKGSLSDLWLPPIRSEAPPGETLGSFPPALPGHPSFRLGPALVPPPV
jgi:hypothetical protein